MIAAARFTVGIIAMKLLKVSLLFSALSLGAMVYDSAEFLASKEVALDLGAEISEEYSDFLGAARRLGCSICGESDSSGNNRLNVLFLLLDPLTQKMHLAAHRKCYKSLISDLVKDYIDALNEKHPGLNVKAIIFASEMGSALKKANEKFGVKNLEQLSTKTGGDELLEEFFEEKSLKLQGYGD